MYRTWTLERLTPSSWQGPSVFYGVEEACSRERSRLCAHAVPRWA